MTGFVVHFIDDGKITRVLVCLHKYVLLDMINFNFIHSYCNNLHFFLVCDPKSLLFLS